MTAPAPRTPARPMTDGAADRLTARPTTEADPTACPATGVPAARPVPWWALASAVAAPVAMIGGWTLAQALQPSFDPVRDTISDLATATMVAPWVMGAGLAVTGLAHCVTASGLRSVPPAGRALLALGGVATLAVALFPSDTHAQLHGITAAVAFGALGLWPALAARRGETGLLSPKVSVTASVVLLGLVAVFVAELQQLTPDAGAATGLTERLVAGAQSLWPLVVTVALHRRATRRHPGATVEITDAAHS